MTRRRWMADEVRGDEAALLGDHAAHLSHVLRAQVGQQFDIGTPTGVRRGTVTSISDTRVKFALGEEVVVKATPQVTLSLAIFKFDRMEWAIEKSTEIGVARIIPVIASRTATHLAAAAIKRRERWQRLARQAAEQSRRLAPPEITAPLKLKDLNNVEPADGTGDAHARPTTAGDSTIRIVLAETESETRLRDILRSTPSRLALAIGPEGGWTPDELQWFRESGWATASLGDTILRTETAAIVATALAIDALR